MIVISFTACYEQLPDPEVLALCLRDSFREYQALVQPKALRKPRTTAGKAAAASKAPRRKAAVAAEGKETRRRTVARAAVHRA